MQGEDKGDTLGNKKQTVIVIGGAENSSEMKKILGTTGSYNPKKFQLQLIEISRKMVAENQDIGPILLECIELPPHAHAIQKAVGMPVWGFPTLVNWIYSGVVNHPFNGFI